MANLRDLNSRILTLRNMQKVMRAMNMIASVKLHKLSRLQTALFSFEKSVEVIASDIRKALGYTACPLVPGFRRAKKAHVVILTADKGLCGSHNSSVHRSLDRLIKDRKENNAVVDVTCIGLKGAHFCKRRGYDIYYQTEINDRALNAASIKKLSSRISKRFWDNEFQEIYLIANYFISTLHQDTVVTRLIPFVLPSEDGQNGVKCEFNPEIEPELDTFTVLAQEQYLYYKLTSALFHSYLSEQSSRMTAMENASKNSEDMINHYVTLQNRARQSTITNDLIEIISGKEALKG